MNTLLITGGTGFVGSHLAEHYAKQDCCVKVLDNLSRVKTLPKALKSQKAVRYTWEYLEKNFDNISLYRGDIRDLEKLLELSRDVDVIIHTAAQVAVTSSLVDPLTDFYVNALGTLNVLEAARQSKSSPAVVYCSTNKVYGDNINKLPIVERETRYAYRGSPYAEFGVPETISIDHCEHTPYGCSKLVGDIYTQDYARRGEIRAAVFRMSCIYGPRQFGNEDQGWVAHFAIQTVFNKPITIYGDGKQVRDVLYVEDLVRAFDSYLKKQDSVKHVVYNLGGGPRNTLSLIELLDLLEKLVGQRSDIYHQDWRPGDQKVYISDIRRAGKELGWQPLTSPETGVSKMLGWIGEHRDLLA